MNEGHNPYQAYTEGTIFSSNPLQMVVALYEGALKNTARAAHCLQEGDILGRGRAINKAHAILSELLVSLDMEKGSQISQNLRELYLYMQTKLVEAHTLQAAGPLTEVTKLLKTLLEGWQQASETFGIYHTLGSNTAAQGSQHSAADANSRHQTERSGYCCDVEEHAPQAGGYSF